MLPTTAPSARPTIRCRRIVGGLAAGALLLGACSGSEGADEPEDTSTTEATTTNEDATTTTNVPEGPTSEDLEAILPTAAELGDGFTEVETPEQPSYFRLAMIDRCPGAQTVLDSPEGAVERTIVALLERDPWQLVVPGQIYHEMGKAGKCCGCFPQLVDLIIETTEVFHRERATPDGEIVSFLDKLRDKHRQCETARLIARKRMEQIRAA